MVQNNNYVFGYYLNDLLEGDLDYIFSLANQKRNNLLKTSTEEILKIIDKVSSFFLNADDNLYTFIYQNLRNIGFSKDMIKLAVIELAKIFTYESIKKRIEIEMHNFEIFDKWIGKDVKVKAFPLGLLVHITAGNVFVSSIDSLLNGIITRNINIVKTSSKVGNFFGLFWIETLKKAEKELSMDGIISDNIAIISYKSDEFMDYINKYADAVVVWGSYDTIKYFASNFDPRKKLITFGPKYSIAVIDKGKFIENIDNDSFYEAIVWDVCLWEQRACSSVQTVYLVGKINKKQIEYFCQKLSKSIKNFSVPQDELSFDEYTEIFKNEEICLANQVLGKGKYYERVYWDYNDITFFIGPLNRFVCVKNVENKDKLKQNLIPYSTILQSCSLLVQEEDEYITTLQDCGITRFVKLGKIGFNEIFAPHEGEYILRRFSKLVSKT
ncbi:MAG: acyl-CoA reductase [bacterium]